MTKVPSIKGSAQARLLLYRLFSHRLTDTEQQLLITSPSSWEQIIVTLEKALISDAQLKSNHAPLMQVFSQIERTTREGLQNQIKHLTGQSIWLGVFPNGLLDDFIKEHQTLITSVSRQHLEKISLTLQRGIREGRLQKDMVKEIRQMTNLSKRRAQLIARNAPLQYSGALTCHHQVNAGIRSYRWQSSKDERVRESHRKLDGQIFNWNEGGPHPRNEINCRCDAVPLLT